MHISSKELVARLRTELPLIVELPDAVTGQPFIVNRDNVLALLAINMDDLVLESQTVAMLFGEMARVSASAKLEKESADVRFRQWKAAKAAEARRTLTGGTDAKGNTKPPTGDQVEEYYRAHPDYEGEYRKANRAAVFVDLMEDLKEAFRMKQRSLHSLHSITFGHDRVQGTDDRMREMEAVSEERATQMMASSAQIAADIREQRLPPPPAVQTTLPVPPAADEPKSSKRPRRPTGDAQ